MGFMKEYFNYYENFGKNEVCRKYNISSSTASTLHSKFKCIVLTNNYKPIEIVINELSDDEQYNLLLKLDSYLERKRPGKFCLDNYIKYSSQSVYNSFVQLCEKFNYPNTILN
jgi:hypothetical protein